MYLVVSYNHGNESDVRIHALDESLDAASSMYDAIMADVQSRTSEGVPHHDRRLLTLIKVPLGYANRGFSTGSNMLFWQWQGTVGLESVQGDTIVTLRNNNV